MSSPGKPSGELGKPSGELGKPDKPWRMDRDDRESLSNLLRDLCEMQARMTRAGIDAAACQTARDFNRAHRAEDEFYAELTRVESAIEELIAQYWHGGQRAERARIKASL